ncbi:bacteriocin fulvocin C-related protein [Fibrella arboris]|uniref:bacteriocin fulvocin C-related protein n=1 Tax=Fibrella arboris TaxID=3242486 RepID=UPI0035211917
MTFLRINSTVAAIAFLLVGLVGCTVQETTPALLADAGINQELVKEVAAISERQVQKIAFTQMLTAQEKTFLFRKRITEKLQVLSLTTEQKEHLTLLLTNMTPEMYDFNSAAGRKAIVSLSAWTDRARTVFDKETLYDIVGSLSPKAGGGGGSSTNKMAEPPSVNCGCATSSSYCGDGYDCNYIPSCNARGCGTLFVYTCNGVCDRSL